jgi:hypothetical protein
MAWGFWFRRERLKPASLAPMPDGNPQGALPMKISLRPTHCLSFSNSMENIPASILRYFRAGWN